MAKSLTLYPNAQRQREERLLKAKKEDGRPREKEYQKKE
jgi:hypothetical protein